MADKKLTGEECLRLLRDKKARLEEQGETRYPKRSDFSEREVVAIKAFFGPWPRALEAAGIKPPRNDDHAKRNEEKRIRAKRRRIAAMKQAKSDQKEQKSADPNGAEVVS